jgi:hypothetical protein
MATWRSGADTRDAVIVGERIFRTQIEQMSSAKYRIEGTIDDPQVALVRVFANEMRSEALTAADLPDAGAPVDAGGRAPAKPNGD